MTRKHNLTLNKRRFSLHNRNRQQFQRSQCAERGSSPNKAKGWKRLLNEVRESNCPSSPTKKIRQELNLLSISKAQTPDSPQSRQIPSSSNAPEVSGSLNPSKNVLSPQKAKPSAELRFSWINPSISGKYMPDSGHNHPKRRNPEAPIELNTIKAGLLNVNSIKTFKRASNVQNLIDIYKINVLCLTETKLSEKASVQLTESTPHNFIFLHKSRPQSSRGGGVGVLIRKDLLPVKLNTDHMNISSFEHLAVSITANSKRIIVVCLYRKPQQKPILSFLNELEKLIADLKLTTPHVILAGDFNIPVNKTTPSTTQLLAKLNDIGFENTVTGPTFIKSQNTLDLVIQSYLMPLVKKVVIQSDYKFSPKSDHHLITFEIDAPFLIHKLFKNISFVNYSVENITEFLHYISEKIDEVEKLDNPSESVKLLKSLITEARDKFLPVITKRVPDTPGRPWYNDECKILKSKYSKLMRMTRQMRKSKYRKIRVQKYSSSDCAPSTSNNYQFGQATTVLERDANPSKLEIAVRNARNKYIRVIRKAKHEYYTAIFENYVSAPTIAYKSVAHLLGRKKDKVLPSLAKTDPQALANQFINFLLEKIRSIRAFIESNPPDPQLKNYIECNYLMDRTLAPEIPPLEKFEKISETDLDNLLFNFNITNCPLDVVNFSKVKLKFFLPTFLHVINSCFETGIFPESEKTGIIYPQYKGNNLPIEDLSSQRGITNLPLPSKIVEKAMLWGIQKHLNANNLYPKFQSAYRNFHSTETLLLQLHSDLIVSIDRSESVFLILLDLSSAFDTVDHEILIQECYHLGIRDKALELIKSFLSNRKVKVMVDEKESDTFNIPFGVPQGSILSPTLFCLYIKSLTNLLDALDVKYQFYADDFQIYWSFDPNNLEQLKNKINTIFKHLEVWMSIFKLKLNIGKTKIMMFGPKKTIHNTRATFGTVKINESTLTLSKEVRNLGVCFDEDLTFQKHITNVVRACNYAIFNIKTLKPVLSFRLLITLMHQEVLSRVDYCNSILLGLPKKQLRRLQKVINNCARAIYGVPYNESVWRILEEELHWLPIGARIDFKILLIVQKFLICRSPEYLNGHLKISNNNESRLQHNIIEGNRKFAKRSFHISAPILHSKIPQSLHDQDIESFKGNLKTYLYHQAFEKKLDSLIDYNPSPEQRSMKPLKFPKRND